MILELNFIISNLKWLYNNQIFMDYINLKDDLGSIIDKLSEYENNIKVETSIDLLINYKPKKHKNLYNHVLKLYGNSINKNTYIPILTGLYFAGNI